MQIDNTLALVNGEQFFLDAPPPAVGHAPQSALALLLCRPGLHRREARLDLRRALC